MSAKPFGKLREQLEERPGGVQALDRARESLDAEIAAYEAGLAELRRARNLTQTQLARHLEISQGEVSRIERRADLYLSTLQSYIEAMGGELELVAVFDEARVRLAIGELVQPAEADDKVASEDAEAAPADAASAPTWEVSATLQYRGKVSDKPIETVRAEILDYKWVTGDAVWIGRGHYSDQVDVRFELKASNEEQAKRRAAAALRRGVLLTDGAVRPSGRVSVELKNPVV